MEMGAAMLETGYAPAGKAGEYKRVVLACRKLQRGRYICSSVCVFDRMCS